MLADRYRIIGLLGQGGMGEVYRANDLKLGQPVALKFLPAATAKNQQLLARFHAEVRIARQVSHPNVCRVYDIGEVDGSTFLSMEYVDGEDLRSLLRRIGRLPGDKAIEIARKLCAGLAAAHDKGVLHRDLKPANIMIDGRGQVLITDFGLAALAGQLEGAHLRDGTPAYMAPEQLAGKEVSVRSDVYALGLVLHEMFTGKRAFENGSERTTPTSSDFFGERHRSPGRARDSALSGCRPAQPPGIGAGRSCGIAGWRSAGRRLGRRGYAHARDGGRVRRHRGNFGARGRHLAGADPGGSGGGGGAGRKDQRAPARRPSRTRPTSWPRRARDLIQSFGYAEPPADRAYGFLFDTDYQKYAERRRNSAAISGSVGKRPAAADPFLVSTEPATPGGDQFFDGVCFPGTDPPPINSGMVGLNLDPQGRLIQFDAVPPQVEEKPDSSRPPDWPALFTAAGLDMARFTPAEPQWVPVGRLRCPRGVDRVVRAVARASFARGGGLVAREAGVLSSDRTMVQARKDAARSERCRGSVTVFLAVLVIVASTGCLSRLAQLPCRKRGHPGSEPAGGVRLWRGDARMAVHRPSCFPD